MKYIDLTLKRLDKENDGDPICTLGKAIAQNTLIVLLGTPGSGKSTLLQKYNDELKDGSQLFTIKKFLRLSPELKPSTKVIFLDGLDEYRSISNDKAFVMTKLGDRIRQFAGNCTIVISCREMDWYGETDVSALKDEIDKDAELYVIQPLDDTQQRELATIFDIDNIDAFISKFSPLGFLDNPQMFRMLSELYKDNNSESILTKTGLYSTFIKNAREQNQHYKINDINFLEPDEILKYAGYLSFFYMFSDIDVFDTNIIDEICNAEGGYPKEKLETVTKSTLFSEKKFSHRTITEFILASFIKEFKLGKEATPGISLARIRSLFVTKNGRIPTELRGIYAWLCSLTKDSELIAVDPYYQAVHGDNSLFSTDLKKGVVQEVKNYSLSANPYFYKTENRMQLDGFYDPELDDFLISEFNSAIELDNHYVYFLCKIFSSTDRLSKKIKEFIKKAILNPKIPSYYKRPLVDVFEDESTFLIEVLGRIKGNEIEDGENYLVESLLSRLYPKHITPNTVADYLNLYRNKVVGFCHYLFDTEYKDKFELVDKIHKNSFYIGEKGEKPYLKLPENTEMFIEDYFLETLLKFEDGLTARDIFDIISHFKKYYKSYDKLEFKSYRYEITDKLPSCEDKLQRLSNELFAIYVDDILSREPKKDSFISFDYFHHYFFGYKVPTNISEVLLSRIGCDRDPEVNKSLFWNALLNYPKGEVNCKKIWEIAKNYNLEAELNRFLNPKKPQWEIENEKRRKKEKEKEQKILENNEKHFASRTDEEILATFSELHFIGNLVYFDRGNKDGNEYLPSNLTPVTFERLKGVLKQAIFAESLIDPELLCLKSLAKNSPDARRNIDRMYYSSCCINNWEEIEFKDEEFFRYLFINVLMQKNMSGIKTSNLVEQVISKKPDLACSIIKEYIGLIFEEYFSDKTSLFMKYVRDETDIERLISILGFFYSSDKKIKDELLYEFIKTYNFSIFFDDLEVLGQTASTEKNNQAISSLKTIAENNKPAFNVNMAIAVQSLLSMNYKPENFIKLDSNLKIQILDYMLSQFSTPESIESRDGFQSPKDSCAGFLRQNALGILTIDELKKLQEIRKGEEDIWGYRITHMISQKEQADTDSQYSSFNIEKIKNFILSDDIVSSEDFFADICEKLMKLKTEIEDNRNNEKDFFYNQDGSSKREDSCRDVILLRLQDKYGYDLLLTKEKYEANNRADLNIKYAANSNFEIQIECKRDKNPEIYKGIPAQLIEKYFSSGVQYGIYLIFYFGTKEDKNAMLDKVNNSIPDDYRNKIEVVCIDLKK